MEHSHDSCTPDLARDLVVAGLVEPVSRGASLSAEDVHGAVHGAKDQPSLTVSPVITVTPFSLTAEVITRSEQVPVVVLLGSSVDPGMSVLRRSLSTAAAAAGLRWILAIVDADRFPQIIAEFRPSSLPTVTVVAGGTGVASWSPHDALGDNGVDSSDWVAATVSTVAPRLTGLPAETVIKPSGLPDVAGETADDDYLSDPRLHRAADLVGAGEPLAAVDLYDEMLEHYSSTAAQQTLRQARAAVRVLVRTQGLDQAAVFTVLSSGQSSERLEGRDLAGVLRTADVFVLADRPADAVDLLSASLAWCSAQEREEIRVRLLDLVLLLETDAPAAVRARMRLASALF